VNRPRGLTSYNCIRLVGFAALAAAMLAWATPTALGAASGGTRFVEMPRITKLECTARCASSGAANGRAGLSSTLAIRDKGVLRLRVTHFESADRVIFYGARNTRRDDVRVSPRRATRTLLEVVIPKTASSGLVAIVADNGENSRAFRVSLRIVHDPITGPQTFIWPVRGPITGPFGEDRGDHIHAGLDIAAPDGTPIKAAAAGRVTLMAPSGGYGNFTCITHVTLTTCYAHQSRFGTAFGATVRQGQVIGYVGNTGNSFGAHLHFEVRNGTSPQSTPINPVAYLPR
jgi:murein DD-endopeptidase MepM/ murein hydrolase activator NlpD